MPSSPEDERRVVAREREALRQTGAALDAEQMAEADRADARRPRRLAQGGRPYQVFLLTPRTTETLTLAHAIEHQTRGRGSGWARGHARYTSEDALAGPEDEPKTSRRVRRPAGSRWRAARRDSTLMITSGR